MVNDALALPVEHPIKLPVFEGPLDLLLFLIRRNEIDIYDIPIETVTRQYLGVLREREEMQLETAGEFFVMAATLMHIKSRMLLPKNELPTEEADEEEEFDPRWELVQQLIEYRKFKDAAINLEELIEEAQKMLQRRFKVNREELSQRPLQPTDKIEIWNVFNLVLRRLSEKITIGQIHDETVTVADRMEAILQLLQTQRRFAFSSMFSSPGTSLSMIVAGFLAILELARLNELTIAQEAPFDDIFCEARTDDAGD
jgi:segregation and condensation protein A